MQFYQDIIEDSESSLEGSCGSSTEDILSAKRVTHQKSSFGPNIINTAAAYGKDDKRPINIQDQRNFKDKRPN